MKRRDFLNFFLIFTSVLVVTGVFRTYADNCGVKEDPSDVKIKKYPGKIKTAGDEIKTEGKWNG